MEVKSGQKSSAGRSRRSWPLLPLVFFLILAGVSVLLHVEKYRRASEVRKVKKQYSLLVQAQPIEETKAKRARFYQIQYYLGYPTAAAYAVAGFIRRLGAVFQPRKILALQIDADLQHFDFKLTVAIDTGAPGAVPWKFAGYYEELRNFPDVSDLSFKEKGPAYRNHSRMFTITGSVELP